MTTHYPDCTLREQIADKVNLTEARVQVGYFSLKEKLVLHCSVFGFPSIKRTHFKILTVRK